MIKLFNDQLSSDLCKEIVKELRSCEYKHDVVTHTWQTIKRHEELMAILHFTIKDYLTELDMEWFTEWNGYSQPR